MKRVASMFFVLVVAVVLSVTKKVSGRTSIYFEDSRVVAEVTGTCDLLESNDPSAAVITRLLPFERVEILRDYQSRWYLIKVLSTDTQGWLQGENLNIPPEPPVNRVQLTNLELENWADTEGGTSATGYLVLVDIGRQRVSVFSGDDGNWRLVRIMVCSTGKNQSPTIRGRFKVIDRGPWFYSERLGAGGRFWIRFDGPYLFHSVAMDRDRSVIDGVLGQRASSGCVRLALDDIKWLYDHVPDGTTVVIP